MNRYAVVIVVSAEDADEAERGILDWCDRDNSVQYMSHPLMVPSRDGAYDIDSLLLQCLGWRLGTMKGGQS